MSELTSNQEIIKEGLLAYLRINDPLSPSQISYFFGQKQAWYHPDFDSRYADFTEQDMLIVLADLVKQNILTISKWKARQDIDAIFGFVFEPLFSLSEALQPTVPAQA